MSSENSNMPEIISRCMQALQKFKKQEYDLPLQKSEDSRFLAFLIGLMSFLAILALTGTFALNGMTSRWSSGLENKITIEIPIETSEGHLLSRDTVQKETQKLAKALEKHPNTRSIQVLGERDMIELVSPWLGDDLNLNDIPLPSLISAELKISNPETIAAFIKDIEEQSEFANVETHQDWLGDLIHFARTLKILSLCIALIVVLATIAALTAGIRTRFAIHRKDIELLHLIGASDDYIARQFQGHAMIIALRGSVIGTILGIIITVLIIALSGFSGTSLIPKIEISVLQFMAICLVPLAVCLIAAATSRFAALHTLAKMP